MKSIIKLTLVTTVLLSALVSCSKDEIRNEENADLSEQVVEQPRYHNFPWVYIMDTNFSKETCATGPGVCFQNEGGDILIYGNGGNGGGNNGNYVEEVRDQMAILMEGNNDPDKGVVAYRLVDKTLQIVFSRSLEEQNLIVLENYELRSDLARAFKMSGLKLPQGEYQVDRSNFEHGEVRVSLR